MTGANDGGAIRTATKSRNLLSPSYLGCCGYPDLYTAKAARITLPAAVGLSLGDYFTCGNSRHGCYPTYLAEAARFWFGAVEGYAELPAEISWRFLDSQPPPVRPAGLADRQGRQQKLRRETVRCVSTSRPSRRRVLTSVERKARGCSL